MILEFKILNTVALPHNENTRKELEKAEGTVIHAEYKRESKGSLSMLGLWFLWMGETSDYMAGNGVTMPLMISAAGKYVGSRPFNKDDAHALFSAKWLGSDENGNRLSWSRDKKHPDKTIADTGQRHHALSLHDIWCTEKGIKITIPIKSEYRELMERMSS